MKKIIFYGVCMVLVIFSIVGCSSAEEVSKSNNYLTEDITSKNPSDNFDKKHLLKINNIEVINDNTKTIIQIDVTNSSDNIIDNLNLKIGAYGNSNEYIDLEEENTPILLEAHQSAIIKRKVDKTDIKEILISGYTYDNGENMVDVDLLEDKPTITSTPSYIVKDTSNFEKFNILKFNKISIDNDKLILNITNNGPIKTSEYSTSEDINSFSLDIQAYDKDDNVIDAFKVDKVLSNSGDLKVGVPTNISIDELHINDTDIKTLKVISYKVSTNFVNSGGASCDLYVNIPFKSAIFD